MRALSLFVAIILDSCLHVSVFGSIFSNHLVIIVKIGLFLAVYYFALLIKLD